MILIVCIYVYMYICIYVFMYICIYVLVLLGELILDFRLFHFLEVSHTSDFVKFANFRVFLSESRPPEGRPEDSSIYIYIGIPYRP